MDFSKRIEIADFNYPLPGERIAAFPLPERADSKLLVYQDGCINSTSFSHLPAHLEAGSMLVFNNTRVIQARILFQKPSGGVVEVFCLEPADRQLSTPESLEQTSHVQWLCMIGGASKWKKGQVLEKTIEPGGIHCLLHATYMGKREDAFIIQLSWTPEHLNFADVLEAAGAVPLPPYIKRKAEPEDKDRYQTLFAEHKGSVAAPTAALHFTEAILSDLKENKIDTSFVTLHVGAGTFKPVKTKTIAEHNMHAEEFQVDIDTLKRLQQNAHLIAVGTTTLRTLESLYWIGIKIIQSKLVSTEIILSQWEAYELDAKNISFQESLSAIINFLEQRQMERLLCETSLLIVPGYEFRSVRALITNFHQPQSTLLLLVAAFIGEDWKKVYNYALEHDYRFLSYGDSSLLWRNSKVE